ncbi:MAG: hypothetical protein B7X86_05755 [Sphingobacteriales bacterium 17-39-43]|uniref:hypothetical protein n=1 Tax=Daejeonella sp. TaxID=2805397 RepID=UPI000BD7FFD1|nr:hypothetical protein [Daejeonella sp.]OYZ31964.1 MAG: hypothetical protein B7Y24_06570 [Sphingobacteriales bacterium 16-39-50]OZA25268.1 MAG: hypothetical protein B7X86_05755 [Sphingobacteriales bacterium 17-39-43]OZA62030.1 MAG: hypothetical protein B7X75_00815 [Sphingobacteriales bacterium 39-40-5]HQS50482.1 hypothetical protein [Daejeonella sp.]HQT23712.1 hypothetical protein [Daejeonella sp.]
MAKKQMEIATGAADSFPITEIMDANPLFTRRQMLGIAGMAGLTAFAGNAAAAAFPNTQQSRPRIAVLASYWAFTRSHADWIVNKLIDGYWWDGAYTPSRVDVVSIYIHQHDESLLGQKVAKAKGIPVYKTVAEAVTLGGKELAVDGVVIVAEHGEYATDLRGHWLLPRWWIYQQVVRVFEQSKRSVPVFNDKHLSYNWDEAKWMFDKSRELNFPLTGGSSIPVYYRKPEIEIDIDTPIKNSIVIGGAGDEGGIFHAIDVLQCFVERRKGGESGVKSIQSIRGPEAWKWVERNPWAGKLLDSVAKRFEFKPGYFQESPGTNICVIEYNDGTKAAVIGGRGVGWTYAGEIAGKNDPTIISMLGWAGPYDQYHASNAQPHWITEMMVTKKEPFNAERLLLSTGITNHYMESNWEGSKYSAVGRRLETPALNIKYRSTRGAQFSKGERPPARPYIRGFDQ